MPNTPSPEAISAAQKEISMSYYPSQNKDKGRHIQSLLDTQTASLRKRVEELELINAKQATESGLLDKIAEALSRSCLLAATQEDDYYFKIAIKRHLNPK